MRAGRRDVRDREGRGHRRRADVHVVRTDRGDADARRWSSTRSAGAASWARGDDVQPPEALLSRGLEVHPDGAADDLELWLDQRYVPAGYGWSFPAARRGARRRRLVRPALTTSRSPTLAARRRRRRPSRALPGQLDPARAAPGRRGRRVLRRRQRRALPAGDRRGHPHRAVLRPGLRPRAARRRRGPADPRGGAGRATRRSPTPTRARFASSRGPRTSSAGSSRASGCCGWSSAC